MGRGQPQSPRINHLSWGHMTVADVGSGKDFKLWPGGGRAWDWTETGTHHVPGVQPQDVDELLVNGSRIVVLTRGMLLRLRTSPRTLELLEQKGILVYVAETRRAARIYKELVESREAVGALFHSTC